jgi:hypothetical protein
MFLIDTTFVDHPELRGYFYEGRRVPADDPNRDRVFAMAELLLDHFDYILLQVKCFPTLYPEDFWTQYMQDCFSSSPVLCEFLENKKRWYSAELVVMMQQCVAGSTGHPIEVGP